MSPWRSPNSTAEDPSGLKVTGEDSATAHGASSSQCDHFSWTVIGAAAAADDESAVTAPIVRPNVVAASAVAANRGCVMKFRTCVKVVDWSPGAAGSKLQAVAAAVRAP